MFVQRFCAWSADADAARREAAIAELAGDYAAGELDPSDRQQAAEIFAHYLDDPDITVRAVLARTLAEVSDLPVGIVRGLCEDVPDVCCPMFAQSPLLKRRDLVAAIGLRDDRIDAAIASRTDLDELLVRTIVRNAARDGILALIDNDTISLGSCLLHALAERFQSDAEIAECLLMRDDIEARTRHLLTLAVSERLRAFASGLMPMQAERFERVNADAIARATVQIAADAEDGSCEYAQHLEREGHINAGLLLRALCDGQDDFATSLLARLADMPEKRIRSVTSSKRVPAIRSLLVRAGLPTNTLAILSILLTASRSNASLSRAEFVLDALDDAADVDAELLALLTRIANEDFRRSTRSMVWMDQAQAA